MSADTRILPPSATRPFQPRTEVGGKIRSPHISESPIQALNTPGTDRAGQPTGVILPGGDIYFASNGSNPLLDSGLLYLPEGGRMHTGGTVQASPEPNGDEQDEKDEDNELARERQRVLDEVEGRVEKEEEKPASTYSGSSRRS